jgi:SNF2 family DNA or RNA helicase
MRTLSASVHLAPLPVVPLPLNGLAWRAPLPPYQQVGIARLLTDPGVLLADEMGLGKTIQAIGALRLLLQRGADEPALIVVPAGLVLQWRRQLREWAPELTLSTCIGAPEERWRRWKAPAQVYLTSFDALRGDMALPAPFGPRRRVWQVVVADEAQRIKNAHTAIAATVKALPRRRAWALTGTPLENRPDDAVSILDFVAPGLCDRGAMIAGLRRALALVQLRRRRVDVLPELPSKTVFEVAPALLPVQRAAYDIAHRQGLVWLRSLGAALRVTHVLELILRLKQICNACPRTGASAKLEDLAWRLHDVAAAGEKALVFSQFVAEPFGAEAIAAVLKPLNPLLLTGRMSSVMRDQAVTQFAAEPGRRVLVASLRAGGLGLNLTAASVVVHFDRWWNPAVETQAEDRAHRIGQTRPVQVFAYLTPDSIEQRIGEILDEKRALFADIIDGVTTASLRRLDLPTLLRAVDA